MEIWKDVPNYEGLYQISSFGRVKNLKGKILKGHTNTYKSVSLRKNKTPKGFLIHRLVALAFLPNPHNKKCVNHKDLDKLNNHVTNLEWVSNQENIAHFKENLNKHEVFLLKEKAINVLKKSNEFTEKELSSLFNFYYRNFKKEKVKSYRI